MAMMLCCRWDGNHWSSRK